MKGKTLHGRGQYPHIAGGRRRPEHRGGLQGEEYLLGDPPPLEEKVRANGPQ
jgi:hypothetical protein